MAGRFIAGITTLVLVALLLPSSGSVASFGGSQVPGGVGEAAPLWLSALGNPSGHVCSAVALCPAMIRTAYNFTGLVGNASRNGSGESIAIVVACGDSLIQNDLRHFDAGFHLPPVRLTVYHPQGRPCTRAVWQLEAALDVEWAHVAAPGAAINLVVAARPYTASLYSAWNYTLNHQLGRQISNSWGAFSDCAQTARHIIARAVSHGVTVVAAAGDFGAWGSGPGHGTPLVPADCGKALTVGGTTLSVGGSGRYKGEVAWSYTGGGYVPGSTEPPYESYAALPDNFSELAKPDVAAVADPATPVWVYVEKAGGWLTVGGTSVSAPIWAGLVADANSWRSSHLFPSLGDLDPYLFRHVYGVNGTSANYSSDVHDVTSGSNGWSAGIGWDPDTGMGSPDAGRIAEQLGTDPTA